MRPWTEIKSIRNRKNLISGNISHFILNVAPLRKIHQRNIDKNRLFYLLDLLGVGAQILADLLDAILWYDGADQLLALLRLQPNHLHLVVPRTAEARQNVLHAAPNRQHGTGEDRIRSATQSDLK